MCAIWYEIKRSAKQACRAYFQPMWQHPWLFWGTVIPVALVMGTIETWCKEYLKPAWWCSVAVVACSIIAMIWRDRHECSSESCQDCEKS